MAVSSAKAAERRRIEETDFGAKEFDRNRTMFRRGLINKTTMEAVERRMLDARFGADQAREAIASAQLAYTRAEIAVEIDELDLKTAEIERAALRLAAPFDGVLLGFDPRVGACVSEGELAAENYDPKREAVDVYVLISRLTGTGGVPVARGTEAKVVRGNGESCAGRITWIETEADLESQYVKTTIDLSEDCAPGLYLNEAVEVEMVGATDVFRIPAGALEGNAVYLISPDGLGVEPLEVEIIERGSDHLVVRMFGAAGRSLVVNAQDLRIDGLLDPS
ncbi:efflux RND transporter periplasmic adaptor subunit [Sagittula sp. NFXS13]|uniref:efflux RND transporter periplasmic adaptor subunit n=1 Tax=Sagittula sp. NFXS13 TaxID=2819095 RepID=UPI0032DFF798